MGYLLISTLLYLGCLSQLKEIAISRRTNISVSVLYINVPDISNIYPETRLACSN